MRIGLRTTRGTPLIRYAQGSDGVEPGMNLTNQVNKFNDRALRARQSGDHALADYFEHLRDLMVSDAQAGRPRPFKHYLPMAQEEFGDHIAKAAELIKEKIPADRNWLDPDSPFQEYDEYPVDPIDYREHDDEPSGSWYHVSPHRLAPGTKLVPGGGSGLHDTAPAEWKTDSGMGNRRNYVWIAPNLSKAQFWQTQLGNNARIYQVKPGDKPQRWNMTGSEGWVVPHAHVMGEVRTARVAKKWDEPGKSCKYCKSPPTHAILHSEGMAYVQTCDKHLGKGKKAAEGCVPYGPPDPGNIIKIKKIAVEIRHKIPADMNWLDKDEAYEDPHPWLGRENPDSADETRSGKWYHVSPYDLEPGTKLVPRGGPSPGGEGEDNYYTFEPSRGIQNRPNYVWLSPNLNKARSWQNWAGYDSHVYEVHPGDRPQPWNFSGNEGWVAPHATIKRKVVARMANVVLYTKPGCVQCDATHRHLTRNNVPFESVDVTQTPQALEHARSLGYSSAPVVITQDDHWSGYRPDKLDMLKTAGRPYTDEEMAVHRQQGWRGPPCEDPTHIGEIMGRCPDCGRRVAPEQKVAYWDEGPWHNVAWDEDLEDDEDEMPVLPPGRHRGR